MSRSILSNSVSAMALAVSAFCLAPTALAQTTSEADTEDTIVVTGSRIQRDSNLTAPIPVQAVSDDDVTLSGDVNIVDVVNDLPALIGSNSTADNSGAQGTLGAATLNLRNLGTDRTLVLVDGRRHVAGQAGTAAVDVNTIPAALVQRVEVSTGGASAVYGADAVSGVVNFIMKDDFEGVDVRTQYNMSDEGDAARGLVSVTLGRNFDNDRGNATVNFTYENSDNLRQGDRSHTRGDRVASDWPNPLRFVQAADIAQYGVDRLLLGEEISAFCGAGDTTLGSARDPLCSRINGIPSRSIQEFPRFNLSSYGSLIGIDFFGAEFLAYYPAGPGLTGLNLGADGLAFDLNNNGVEDCLETVNGTQLQRFGGFAGCHVTRAPGGPADVFADGLLGGTQNAFGGDGTNGGRDLIDIIPRDERMTVNIGLGYDLTPQHRFFIEAKISQSETVNDGTSGVQAFYDSHVIEWDNPYIPDNLRQAITTFVNDNPGVFNLDDVNILIGRDPTDLGPAIITSDRTTARFVTGFEGEIGDTGLIYEVSANYGETIANTTSTGQILQDRYYAAADAVVNPANGEIVCRSEIDPNTPPIGSFLSSAGYWNGYNTFTPARGLCAPMNLFGVGAPSQEAIDFVTTTTFRSREIKQLVLTGFVAGDTEDWFTLPAGPIDYVVGTEYREEISEFTPDPLETGTSSLIFPVNAPVAPVNGRFDVREIFGEVSVPLLMDQPFAEELVVDGAFRLSQYSNSGSNESWNLRATWAPVSDLRFRGAVSQTVRAPNIFELFSPLTSTTSRPIDPCDAGAINNGSANRAANCAADGIPVGFTDPLTARVAGFTGGNPDLEPETADTITLGFVFQPSFLEGLTVTLDYYDIEINDAIDSVGFQEILEACYDASSFPNLFCDQFERDRTPGSPTFLGLASFTTSELNFAKVAASGWDYQVSYMFEFGDIADGLDRWGAMSLSVLGNHVDSLSRFEDPTDASIENDLLYEAGQPADVANFNARWMIGDLTVNWQTTYYGEMLEITPRLEIETADDFENAWSDSKIRHDLSALYEFSDNVQIYGGINNLFEEQPLASTVAYPVGVVGREFFIGLNVRR
ncbi:TonB-dependent receptor domain-containing protein [Maricaulis sp. CAU 1757]